MSTFTLTEEEYVQACFRLARKSFLVRFLIIVGLLSFMMFQNGGMSVFERILALIVIFSIGLFAPYFFWKRRIQKTYRDEKSFQLSTTLTVTEEAFEVKHERGSLITPWSEVKKCLETKDCYLLFCSQKVARILPKKGFSEEETLILKRKLGLGEITAVQ